MTEKLTINLTEGDVKIWIDMEKNIVRFEAKCPLCNSPIDITRIGMGMCDCDIEWRAEVKIKGTRSVDDEDKFQMPLPIKAEYQSDDVMKEIPND